VAKELPFSVALHRFGRFRSHAGRLQTGGSVSKHARVPVFSASPAAEASTTGMDFAGSLKGRGDRFGGLDFT
jgi:hypothetical protein